MDKVQKFEQTKAIEGYLEQNQVFELFLGLLKQIIVNKPEDPLDFLIQRLSTPARKCLCSPCISETYFHHRRAWLRQEDSRSHHPRSVWRRGHRD